jgi:hypothetical protein
VYVGFDCPQRTPVIQRMWRRSSGSAAFRSRWARSSTGRNGGRRALGRRERRRVET